MRLFGLPLILGAFALVGCGAPRGPETPARAAIHAPVTLPAIRTFSTPRPVPPNRSNADIARDFLDLSFQLESGRDLPRFTRFEEPVSIRVTGAPPPTLVSDLDRLIGRLRSEAGIDVRRVRGGAANITIEAVPRAQIRRALPRAACFVVPNIDRLSEYRRMRNSRATNWAALEKRERIAIFLPNDAAPQEVRDCLHEELAQALGPLNDLYRLSDSVFNDDNVHTVLTGFDMLVLRAYYDPVLRNGMTKNEVAAELPGILSRLNPRGESIAPRPAAATPRAWIDAIQTALGPGAGKSQRMSAARTALRIAEQQGWQDHRRAFSHFANGRLAQINNPQLAQSHFDRAEAFYRRTPGTDLHRAYLATHLAAYAVNDGRGVQAQGLIGPHLDTAERHENAALLATLLLLRAEALDLSGQVSEAQSARLDSVGWARYGFGSDWEVRAKINEIASLRSSGRQNGR
ncbi:MAG: DUF2927 domain-containing protein [Pseudomonadota bacterium]